MCGSRTGSFSSLSLQLARQDSDAAMRAQPATDHAPEIYRFSTVRNLDAWYDAFDVKPGQRLYLEPGERVRIW